MATEALSRSVADHGYFDCYLPLYIDASASALEEVARIVPQIRTRWPRTKILLRADSGFAR